MTNVGIIGCGYWGPNLLRNLASHPRARVAGVADRSPERRAFVSGKYPAVRTLEGHEQLLADPEVEAVIVATPAATHGRLALEALEAGKHVLVEKPLAMSVAEAEALVAAAKARNLVLMAGHTFLFNAAVEALKGYVDDGTLGEPYYLYSQRLNLGIVRSDVNALWNLAPHDVSIVLHLFGGLPTSVSATGACYLQEGIEDVVFMNLRYGDGRLAHVHVSWLDPGKVRRMTVVGSRKMVVYDDVADAKIAVYDKGIDRHPVGADRSPVSQPTEFAAHQLVKRAGDVHLPDIAFTEPLAREVDHFVHCIETGEAPLTGPKNGLDVVRVLEAATHSLARGGAEIAL